MADASEMHCFGSFPLHECAIEVDRRRADCRCTRTGITAGPMVLVEAHGRAAQSLASRHLDRL